MRRFSITLSAVLTLIGPLLLGAAKAAESPRGPEKIRVAHAIAMHGEPKYGPDFTHFDYINPEAPRGGTLREAALGGFDSFNPYIAKGNAAANLGYVFETLMTGSADEAFTEYGLIAQTIEWPEDRSWVAFTLRPEARWHDGRPITAEDVIFSLQLLKTKGHPQFRFYYQSVIEAEKTGPREVRFSFAAGDNRELPLIVGQMPILPKHYWETRDFEKTTLEPPLGSGPYKIADFEPGRHVVYERVADYWGRDLAVNRGQYNFDSLRTDYYRDDTVVRQALKAGNIDFRVENQAKAWALDYDVPAVREGWLKKDKFEHRRPTGMQAFTMNARRAVFQDRRVRRALAFAFDFDWSNRNLFFGQYTRTESYFSNSELAAAGLPSPQEMEILEPYRDRIPAEVFTQEYRAPETDGTGWPRDNLARAFDLLSEAGWIVRDMKLVSAETGARMRFEILLISPAFERIVLPFKRNLNRLGIEVSVRLVDTAQYINRVRAFDFDMIVGGWGQSESPGNEQRNYWTSASAKTNGSRNFAGIEDPVIDALVERIISAPDRESLIMTTRSLDRVLLWGHYVISNWHIRFDRIVYWDKFGKPQAPPRRGTSTSYWWADPDKARALASRGKIEEDVTEGTGDGGLSTAITVLVGGLLLFFGYLSFRRFGGRTAE